MSFLRAGRFSVKRRRPANLQHGERRYSDAQTRIFHPILIRDCGLPRRLRGIAAGLAQLSLVEGDHEVTGLAVIELPQYYHHIAGARRAQRPRQ